MNHGRDGSWECRQRADESALTGQHDSQPRILHPHFNADGAPCGDRRPTDSSDQVSQQETSPMQQEASLQQLRTLFQQGLSLTADHARHDQHNRHHSDRWHPRLHPTGHNGHPLLQHNTAGHR